MGDPHNPKRAWEIWDQDRIDIQLREIEKIKDLVVLSGGWAWHFISPPHREYKTQHDHKDIDIIVRPEDFNALLLRLLADNYKRAATQWDNPSGQFYRYTKFYDGGKIVFDVFLEEIENITVNEFKVVEPNKLISLYGIKHTSEQCTAVVESRKLLAKGISPVGRPELLNVRKNSSRT